MMLMMMLQAAALRQGAQELARSLEAQVAAQRTKSQALQTALTTKQEHVHSLTQELQR